MVPQLSLNWQHEFMQNQFAINGNLGDSSPSLSNWSTAQIRDTHYTGVAFAKKCNTSLFYNVFVGNNNPTPQNIFWSAGEKFYMAQCILRKIKGAVKLRSYSKNVDLRRPYSKNLFPKVL